MLNPATHHDKFQLNEFTKVIFENQQCGIKTIVRLRDGRMIYPVYKVAEDKYSDDVFATDDWWYCWYLDGTSLTRRDLDMMEIIK